ncbi:MAG: N-acetylmuramoyl-L-alanine amidase [Lachnospiraceae bacterium]|nr:N-acetylmuramoyl-L-alanine amidase [Lachnospiraceae bacterium]
MCTLVGCGSDNVNSEVVCPEVSSAEEREAESVEETAVEEVVETTAAEPASEQTVEISEESSATKATEEPVATEASEESSTESEMSIQPDVPAEANGRLIVIDAGHQAKGNSEKEPIGPGASEMKAKVASGTRGCVSGLYEYELTLMVSEKLCQELQNRGYEVMMVRTTHDVNISNAERAQVANEAGADAFIRIHANGSENTSVNGVETLCQTAANPYNAVYYTDSKNLSEQVLDGIINATGAKKRRVVETDTMSGINWCQIPVTIVEMGFMSNETEDALMATEDYQWQLARGMADGIDAYMDGR